MSYTELYTFNKEGEAEDFLHDNWNGKPCFYSLDKIIPDEVFNISG